jgi:hypothetical protein
MLTFLQKILKTIYLFQVEEGKALVRDAVAAGIFNDLV